MKLNEHELTDQIIACIRQLQFDSNNERNQEIILCSIPLTANSVISNTHIGNKFGISSERVRQIKVDSRTQLSSMSDQHPNLLTAHKYIINKKRPDRAIQTLIRKNIIPESMDLVTLNTIFDLFITPQSRS